MDFAIFGPFISKALGTNHPVQEQSPSNLVFQAVCTPNLYSSLPLGSLLGLTLRLGMGNTMQTLPTALSSKQLTALAFAQLAWDESNDFAKKFPVLSRDSVVSLKCRVAQRRGGKEACEPRKKHNNNNMRQ